MPTDLFASSQILREPNLPQLVPALIDQACRKSLCISPIFAI